MSRDEQKKLAAEKALEYVEDGRIVTVRKTEFTAVVAGWK
mgnify:CR=1 FL=1